MNQTRRRKAARLNSGVRRLSEFTLLIHDPATFSVWALADSGQRLAAAKHMASAFGQPVPQMFQIIAEACKASRRVEIQANLALDQATAIVKMLPAGFVYASAVIAEDAAHPEHSQFCLTHGVYYAKECSICLGDHL